MERLREHGVWTIGHGHAAGVREGDRGTPEEAEASPLLRKRHHDSDNAET